MCQFFFHLRPLGRAAAEGFDTGMIPLQARNSWETTLVTETVVESPICLASMNAETRWEKILSTLCTCVVDYYTLCLYLLINLIDFYIYTSIERHCGLGGVFQNRR